MLFGGADAHPPNTPQELSLPDDQPDAFNWLLNYMYRGNANLPSVPMALEVSVLATKYDMAELKIICAEVSLRYFFQWNFTPCILKVLVYVSSYYTRARTQYMCIYVCI